MDRALPIDAAPPRPRQAPRPPLEPQQQRALDALRTCRSTDDINDRFIAPAWRRGCAFGFLLGVVVVGCLALLTGCSSSAGADNTPWGKVSIGTDAKPPPPIYSRSTRSTTTKPPPPAPEVEETTCENGVCGVPVR